MALPRGRSPELARGAAFILLLVGFGTKAGLVPLHVWLPQAHPAAPSNISALMSGIMVKTAVYMLIRCYFDFLGVWDTWWGLLVLLVACISALLGVLYALMEKDIKRALAYSTVENIGLIFIALGAAMVFQSYYLADRAANAYLADLAALALIAALFHTLAHSLFKGLLFMGAGAIMYATHTRNMEELGGLVKRMKWTGVLFFVGALSISAIPPFNGFVSEWLMFQSLLLTPNINDPMVNLLIPVAVAVLALTGALAAACFVRLFGIDLPGQAAQRARRGGQRGPPDHAGGHGHRRRAVRPHGRAVDLHHPGDRRGHLLGAGREHRVQAGQRAGPQPSGRGVLQHEPRWSSAPCCCSWSPPPS